MINKRLAKRLNTASKLWAKAKAHAVRAEAMEAEAKEAWMDAEEAWVKANEAELAAIQKGQKQ